MKPYGKEKKMTREEKQILLVDLCARLPYGVMIEVQHELGKLTSIDIDDNDEVIIYSGDCDEDAKIEYCKPYLRPMSSMTEEERKEYNKVMFQSERYETDYAADIDWLNAHHFDYRGLIPKGLALEAPEDMYEH